MYVVFATQEVADATSKPELLDDSVGLPHQNLPARRRGADPGDDEAYQSVGLPPRKSQILAKAQKKRDYYYRSVKGRRLFELGLGPAALAFVGASSEQDQLFLDELVATRQRSEYARAMLERRGAVWAAAELAPPREAAPNVPDDAQTVPMTARALSDLLSSDSVDSGAMTTVPVPAAEAAPTKRLRWRKRNS